MASQRMKGIAESVLEEIKEDRGKPDDVLPAASSTGSIFLNYSAALIDLGKQVIHDRTHTIKEEL